MDLQLIWIGQTVSIIARLLYTEFILHTISPSRWNVSPHFNVLQNGTRAKYMQFSTRFIHMWMQCIEIWIEWWKWCLVARCEAIFTSLNWENCVLHIHIHITSFARIPSFSFFFRLFKRKSLIQFTLVILCSRSGESERKTERDRERSPRFFYLLPIELQ